MDIPAKSGFNSALTHAILIIALGILVYSNTLDVPFQWDETAFMEEPVAVNPVVKDMSYFLEPSKAKWSEYYGEFKKRYLGYLSFALSYKLHGDRVAGYHAFNIALHLTNALLVYALVILVFQAPRMPALKAQSQGIALFTSLLFVSHPIQTEAVTYIYQRFTLLVAFFYLGSLVCYAKWRLRSEQQRSSAAAQQESKSSDPPFTKGGRGGIYLYFLSLIFALLAMKTKENAFTLPVAVALFDLTFFGRRPGKGLLPFFALIPIIPYTVMDFGRPLLEAAGKATQIGVPRWDYLLTQFSVVLTYLRLLVLPVNQNLDYDYPVYSSFPEPAVFLPFGLLLLLFIFFIYLFYRSLKTGSARGAVAFGGLWFFITLSVESSLISLGDIIFEHRLYLPSVGVFFAAVTGAYLTLEKMGRKRAAAAAVSAFFILILVFSCAAYKRNEVWRTRISLWGDVVRKSPSKERGYINLGTAYEADGQIDRAIENYWTALRIKPDYDIYYLLGNALNKKGLVEEAVMCYQVAIGLKPDYAPAYYNLGCVLLKRGLTARAGALFQEAVRLNPGYGSQANIWRNLGSVSLKEGRKEEALKHYLSALDEKPESAEVHYNLGIIYSELGEPQRGMEHYRAALGLKPGFESARFNLALLYIQAGLLGRARAELETILEKNPANSEARRFLKYIDSPNKALGH